MEDGKKKKNKKKKNKQNKPAVDISNGVGDSAKKDLIQASTQDHQNRDSDITQVQNEVPKIDVDLDTRLSNGVEDGALEESVETSQVENVPLQEQQVSLEEIDIGLQNDQGAVIQKETFLEETSIELQNDSSTHIQKETSLEGTSISLQNDIGAHIQKETSLEETTTGFQNNNSAHIEKEASLDDTSLGLQNNNDGHIQKEASLEETSIGLPHDKGVDIQKKASLESKLLQLEKEKDSWINKQASLESKLLEVEKEKESWCHKQARLEDEFNHLVEKTESLSSKEASLEEKVKQLEMESHLLLEKENSTKETISNLNGNISRLQTQVIELEESRNYLLHENQQLGESISGLQLQIQTLEKHVTSAVSSSSTRTANDLYLKPDPQGAVHNKLPDSVSGSTVEISKQLENADSTSKFTETTPEFTDRIDISKDISIQDERNIAEDLMEKGTTAHVISSLSKSNEITIPSFEDVAFRSEGEDKRIINVKNNIVISNSPYINGSGEIVQIPLDKNNVGHVLQPHLNDEKTDIPLTDSPIIGAPFRMISFFARYVSGSDLVNKS